MWIERATNGFTIVDVVAGGPAAKAGLKSGDVIVAIGGKRYAALPLAQARATLRGAPGTRITLKLASGAQRVVTLRDLI
jgi:carboxyl-terminal processing protease